MAKLIQNDGLVLFERVVTNESITVDPASIADGASATLEFDVPGAAFGDFAIVAAPYGLQGLEPGMPYVSAANKVSLTLINGTGGAVDLPSGAWKVKVLR